MLFWLIATVLAGEPLENPPDTLVLPAADVVVSGTVVSADPGERARVWDLARAVEFNVLLPGAVLPVVCVRVTSVLYGDFMGEKACFYRASGLSVGTEDATGTGDQIVGRDAVWLLREAQVGGHFLYARDREAVQSLADAEPIRRRVNDTRGLSSPAPPAVPTRDGPLDAKAIADLIGVHDLAAVPALREALAKGDPAERVAVIAAVAEYGILPLVPDVIARVDDAARVVSPGVPIGRPVGMYATEALFQLAPRLDGRTDAERPHDSYGYSAEGIDFADHAGSVRHDWDGWWTEWKSKGPVR